LVSTIFLVSISNAGNTDELDRMQDELDRLQDE